MSGTPVKKPHEDVGRGGGGINSSGSSIYPLDNTGSGYPSIVPKLLPSAGSSEYIHHHINPHFHLQPMDHAPHPIPRVLPKIPRSDSSDVDPRENPYRDPKFENREPGMENRGDEGKDLKFNRESYPSEYKSENVKVDKEDFGSGSSSHLYSKECKENHRIKRYTDTPSVDTEMCNPSCSNVHGKIDRDVVEKDDLPEQRDPMEVEKPKEQEQEPDKREASSGVEKDGLHGEKELIDAVGKTPELESVGTDTNKASRKKERDADVEGERPEKRSRYNDKESDDDFPDAETGSERERDVLNSGVQQHKGMLRPQGSPQAANREQCLSSRTQEIQGSQGKCDVSIVTYRAGECMQELLKLWKEYEASQDILGENSQNGPTLEIHIPAEHVRATNRQVRGGQLWGTDIYTNDSDLVAVLMHTGYCRPTASAPPSAVQELRATIRVLPPKDSYISTLRNNVRSRAWGAGISCSYGVESCCILKKGGGTIELEPCLTQTSTVEPTLAPVAVEHTMTTRAAASNASRQQRFVREVTIQYNLCNEPWIKYSISFVADKGLKKVLYTSARLKKGEVLYLETHTRRYELCFMGEKIVKDNTSQTPHDSEETHGTHTANGGGSDGTSIDVFRWSRCKSPLSQKAMRTVGIPLPPEHVEVLKENLDWEDIQWSQTGVFMAGKEYILARAHFISPL